MLEIFWVGRNEDGSENLVPQGVVFAAEPFSAANGLLTSTSKLCRRALADSTGGTWANLTGVTAELRRELSRAGSRSLNK